MRRVVVTCAFLLALAPPAVAAASTLSTGDGQLVVKGANGPRNVPVVALTITGAVIGHISGQGRITIDGGNPEVTGADWQKPSAQSPTAETWGGTDFKFRAVGGRSTIIIYGSGVDVVALGSGTVTLNGLADSPTSDGTYSLNGGDFRSLPGAPKTITISANG